MTSQREGDQKDSPPLPIPAIETGLQGHSGASENDTDAPAVQVFPIFDHDGKVARVIQAGMQAADTIAAVPVKKTVRSRAGRTESEDRGFYGMIGPGPKMKALFETIRVVADSDATVLILGESGTGKELVARAIHRNSPRRLRPFVAIDCGVFPETLLESELFGHVRGSFTGAIQNKKGLLQEAHGGTLFLDEIGDSSPVFQSKLLRVLQEGQIRPVGGTRNFSIDVRVIAATNKSLQEGVRTKAFREDLYYRLSVIPIEIPPLRERREDIRPLAEHFVRKFAAKNRRKQATLSVEAFDRLTAQPWPGNVRELENVIERAVVIARGPEIQPDQLLLREYSEPQSDILSQSQPKSRNPSLSLMEREQIIDALRRHGGNRSKSARELGISRTGLYYMMKRYRITPPY